MDIDPTFNIFKNVSDGPSGCLVPCLFQTFQNKWYPKSLTFPIVISFRWFRMILELFGVSWCLQYWFGAQEHVQKSRNHENDEFSVFPITKSKSDYSSKMKQNNSMELSCYSSHNLYHKNDLKDHKTCLNMFPVIFLWFSSANFPFRSDLLCVQTCALPCQAPLDPRTGRHFVFPTVEQISAPWTSATMLSLKQHPAQSLTSGVFAMFK